MNRRAQSAAAVAIVAFAAAFGFGQDNFSDTSTNKLPIIPSVAIATLDVEKVFKKSKKFNEAMAPIRAMSEAFNTGRIHIKSGEVLAPARKEALSVETKAYADTLQRMNEIVSRICKARDIGLVIRATGYPVNAADRTSILHYVNKQIVYSAVPDLTDEVISELDR